MPAWVRRPSCAVEHGQSEVDQAWVTRCIQKNIFRLQVAVEDVQVVGAAERVGQFQG
jgi:hypothetical protein